MCQHPDSEPPRSLMDFVSINFEYLTKKSCGIFLTLFLCLLNMVSRSRCVCFQITNASKPLPPDKKRCNDIYRLLFQNDLWVSIHHDKGRDEFRKYDLRQWPYCPPILSAIVFTSIYFGLILLVAQPQSASGWAAKRVWGNMVVKGILKESWTDGADHCGNDFRTKWEGLEPQGFGQLGCCYLGCGCLGAGAEANSCLTPHQQRYNRLHHCMQASPRNEYQTHLPIALAKQPLAALIIRLGIY